MTNRIWHPNYIITVYHRHLPTPFSSRTPYLQEGYAFLSRKTSKFLLEPQLYPDYSSSVMEPSPESPLVEAERLAVAVAHMPAPSAIPGNLAQVMHMIHWTLPRPRFKILFVLAAPCSKPVCPERDRRKAPSSTMSVNELATFDRGPTHKTTAMPLDERMEGRAFSAITASIPPQLAPRSPLHRKPCTSFPGLKALLLSSG